MNFKGKVVLITGASSGIGAGTAEYLSKYGASLALVGRNVDNLKKVVDSCLKKGAVSAIPIVADVNEGSQKIIDATLSHYGKLDVLINNVGFGEPCSIETVTLELYDKMMNTNVRSILHLTKLAVPHLLKTKGNIVNVSSVGGTRSFDGFLVYCMSKAALDQFTKCISLELAAKGVRVNSVNPAVIVTNFHKTMGMSDDAYAKYLHHCKTTHPMERVGTVDEVAAAIAFLASDEASFITGTLLPVCGGKNNLCANQNLPK